MKKLIFTSCCFLATVIFCTQGFAGNNSNEKPKTPYTVTASNANASTPTVCCVDAGGDIVIACNGTGQLGRVCNGTWCTNPSTNCPGTYSWAPTSGLSCTNCANPTVTLCVSGVYSYTLTGSGPNCSTTTDVVQVTVTGQQGHSCCGRIGFFLVDNEQENPAIGVFPNPTTGKINVQFSEIKANTFIQVYDMNGNLIFEKRNLSAADKKVEVDLSDKAKGTYFIQVMNANDEGLLNKKVVLE